MRIGNWSETYTGKKFWHLDPMPEDVCLEDIANGLSNVCRFNGQVKFFYSVAQHSLACADLAKRRGYGDRIELLALMHDAAEAYVCDMVSPLKAYINGYRDIENKIQDVIYRALNIQPPNLIEKQIVKGIDMIILITEARVLLKSGGNSWDGFPKDIKPDDQTEIIPKHPPFVKAQFLERARWLGITEDMGVK